MRVAFIYSFESSSWKSCQSITKNLFSAYQIGLQEHERKSFDLNVDLTSFDLLTLAQSIADFNPAHIIFLDHKPHPIHFLKLLHEVVGYQKFVNIQFTFHVFGDFTLYPNEWLDFDDLMDKAKIRFVCASDRQTELVKKFITNPESSVVKCPFPVDEEYFGVNESLREQFRKNLNLKKDDFVFLYTGRISLQKNVLPMLQDFHNFLKVTGAKDVYLVFAGPFDDLGNPYTGIWYHENEFYLKYVELMNTLPEESRSRIFYLGNLSTENLNIVCNGADYFVSLSAHNDEDFGMAPAEALMTGIPVILTNWAGYSSFLDLAPEFNKLISVEHDKRFVRYNRHEFIKSVITALNSKNEVREKRLQISEASKNYLSVKNTARLLKKFFDEEIKSFEGFTELMKKLKKSYANSPPFASHVEKIIPSYTPTYHEIYESYLPEKL